MSSNLQDTERPGAAAAATTGAGAAARPPVRRTSLDVLRGGLLAFMLFTPPFRLPGTYPFLEHVDWLGWSASDLIFPLFLFTSGGSLGYMLRRGITARKANRLVRRLLALLVLGLLYNAIGSGFDLSTLRFTGVLQLIGVSGFLGAVAVTLIGRVAPDRPAVGIGVALGATWVGYAALMALADCWQVGEGCSPFFGVDRGVLGASHLYRQGVGYDPEGLVVMIAASWIVLVGYLATMVVRDAEGPRLRTRAGWMAMAGVASVALAFALSGLSPLSKRVMSPTFMLLAVGVGLVAYGLLVVFFDVEVRGRGPLAARAVAAWPFTTLGWNALIVYMGERIAVVAAVRTPVGDQSAADALLDALAAGYGDRAGLLAGLLLVALLLTITGVMRALDWRVAL
jgi:predicted acyltransferase